MADTPRLAMHRPVGADSFLPTTDLQDIVDTLDNAAIYQQGTYAARPAIGTVVEGTYYSTTDTGVTYRSDGTSWIEESFIVDRVRATRTTAQALSNGSVSNTITFPTEDHDSNTMHDTGAATDRLTVQFAGVYMLHANVLTDAAYTTARLSFRHYDSGGVQLAEYAIGLHDASANLTAAALSKQAAAGDYFRVLIHTIVASSAEVSTADFSAVRVSP